MASEIIQERDLTALLEDAKGIGGEVGILAQIMILIDQYGR